MVRLAFYCIEPVRFFRGLIHTPIRAFHTPCTACESPPHPLVFHTDGDDDMDTITQQL
jgi:hypothetical protein